MNTAHHTLLYTGTCEHTMTAR